jgi:hypothetical protein
VLLLLLLLFESGLLQALALDTPHQAWLAWDEQELAAALLTAEPSSAAGQSSAFSYCCPHAAVQRHAALLLMLSQLRHCC